MEPILKWAGGKRKLLTKLNEVFNLYDYEHHTFYDAFVGGGSVFLGLENNQTVINDYNKDLINVYKVIKNNPLELIDALKKHKKNHSRSYYYQIRNIDTQDKYEKLDSIDRAARTIYLNRTCFNGLTRYNKKGHFNVPFGEYKDPKIIFENRIKSISEYLNNNNVTILNLDFEEAVKNAKKGDLVYFDPPYDYENDGFTSYTEAGWTRNDLERLKIVCDKLTKKGCHIVLSNNDTSFVNDLFNAYKIEHIQVGRTISSKNTSRKKVGEVIVHD